MDCGKTGALIRRLRMSRSMTQARLAQAVGVSPKAVSTWETGGGAPDLSLLPALSQALGVEMGCLLTGEVPDNDPVSGNMKHIQFFVCPDCGSIATSTGNAQVSCCGRSLAPLTAQKADEAHKLVVESVEDEWYLTSHHPMTKNCHLSFTAFALGDSVQITKHYPEWDFQLRLPRRRHGTLYWYSTRDGLFYQFL